MSMTPTRPTAAIMNASGRTAHRLAQRLLGDGWTVRVLGRAPERLQSLQRMGASAHVGDPQDAAYLASAFAGVDLVYGLLPYDLLESGYLERQRRLGTAMAQGVRAARVPRVVFLSSLGAELSSGTGMILSLHEQEQRLADIPWLHARFLRAGDFMENRLPALASLAESGAWRDAVSPRLAVPMVATADIADRAFDIIRDVTWTGLATCEVLGPCDLCYEEVTQVLQAHLGLAEARYEPCSPDALRLALVALGLPEDVAGLTAQISEAIDDGRIRSRAGRDAHNTTATTFAQFLKRLP